MEFWFPDLMDIGILDYQISNIASVSKMIRKVGGNPVIVKSDDQLINIQKLIIPGVGSFDYGIEQILKRFDIKKLKDLALVKKIPILGICLGMQLLCLSSEEGTKEGLGFINAKVKKLPLDKSKYYKLPHMGWNEIHIEKENPLISSQNELQRFYFVHTFFVSPLDKSIVFATTNHGINFCSGFQKDNIFGVQFHPEKSHKFGMKLVEKFIKI